MPGSKVFFTSGGSDSVDTAAKLARRYWNELGEPSRTIVIGRQKAYHGMHYAGTALAGIPGNREGYGELVADAATVAWDSADDLRATIERLGPERVAAFFCEPVIGAGGVYPPPEGYLADVRKVCTEYDVLVRGRRGRHRLRPHRRLMVRQHPLRARARHGHVGQGLTSGYLPMGAVLVAPRSMSRSSSPTPVSGGDTATRTPVTRRRRRSRWPTSKSSSARVCSTRRLGWRPRWPGAVATGRHERVEEVRCGIGAVAAIQMADPAEAMPLAKKLRSHGVATRAVGAGGIQVSPAFVMTDEQVGELAAAFASALDT